MSLNLGLGLPAALRHHAPKKGVGALVLRDRATHQPLTSRATGQYLTPGSALVLRNRATNQPLTSRATGQYLTSRSA